ncbi:unnamed protein product [Lymnaea stagnalis]|uniref:Uncharacterized protein n=1 Tax=Lymnaea stagnalis TaxID=6523 RepID=A0AAV2IMP5_LYMST
MNNQADDINSIDDIDLSCKEWHKLRKRRVYVYPSVVTDQEECLDLLKDFKVVLKGPVNKFFENCNLLLGNLAWHRYFNFGRLRSAKQIMLVDLGEFNLFQFAQSCLRPAETFVLGFSGYESLSEYEMTAFYEQFASYNALKAAQSVEICVPRLERGRLAFFDEAVR